MEIFLQTTYIKIKKNYLILLYLDKIKFIYKKLKSII